MKRNRRPTWLVVLAILLAVFVAYLIVGDFFWRNTHLVSDNEDAIVQPAETPPPGGLSPDPGGNLDRPGTARDPLVSAGSRAP